MYCNKCGTQLSNDSIFCSKCGAKQNIGIQATQMEKGRAYNVSTWEELVEAWKKAHNDKVMNAGFNLISDIVVDGDECLFLSILGEKRHIFTKNDSSIIGGLSVYSESAFINLDNALGDCCKESFPRSIFILDVGIDNEKDNLNTEKSGLNIWGNMDCTINRNIKGRLVLQGNSKAVFNNDVNINNLKIHLESCSELSINGNIIGKMNITDEKTIHCHKCSKLIVNGDVNCDISPFDAIEYSCLTINGNINILYGEAIALKHNVLALINGFVSSQVGVSVRDDARCIISGNIISSIGVIVYNCVNAKLLVKGSLDCRLAAFIDHRSFVPDRIGGIDILITERSNGGVYAYVSRYMGRVSPNIKETVISSPEKYPLRITALDEIKYEMGLIKQLNPSLSCCIENVQNDFKMYNTPTETNEILASFEDLLWNGIESPIVVSCERDFIKAWNIDEKSKVILLALDITLTEPLKVKEGHEYIVKSMVNSLHNVKIVGGNYEKRPKVMIDVLSIGDVSKSNVVPLIIEGAVDVEVVGNIYSSSYNESTEYECSAIKAEKGCNVTIRGNINSVYNAWHKRNSDNSSVLKVKSAFVEVYGSVQLIGGKNIPVSDCCAVYVQSFAKVTVHGNITSDNDGLVVENASSHVKVFGEINASRNAITYSGSENQKIRVSGSVKGGKYGIWAKIPNGRPDYCDVCIGGNVFGEKVGYVSDECKDFSTSNHRRIFGKLSGRALDISYPDCSLELRNRTSIYDNKSPVEKAKIFEEKKGNV